MSGSYFDPAANRNVIELSVSEIERLAKAGVKVEIEPVRPVSDPSDPGPQRGFGIEPPLEQAFWDRWRRSAKAKLGNQYEYRFETGLMPFRVLATQHGDTVWVSIHPINFSYEPFQLKDVSAIFPSDALMANIALWEKEHPSA